MYDCISNHQFSIDLYILKDYCYESFEIFELNRICKAIILKAEVDLHSELRSTNSIEDREWAKKKFSRMEKRVEKLDDSQILLYNFFNRTYTNEIRRHPLFWSSYNEIRLLFVPILDDYNAVFEIQGF